MTGHDEKGRAIVVSDGPAPFLHLSPSRPGFWSNDIWRTATNPASIEATPTDLTEGPRRQLPGKNGSVIRVNHFPPGQQSLNADQIRMEFAALGNLAASTQSSESRHAMMHRTETIDYALVLSGEIYLVLDDSDVKLNAGDIVVQCGTNHAWSNRSHEPCVVAFVLLDGRFAPELSALSR